MLLRLSASRALVSSLFDLLSNFIRDLISIPKARIALQIRCFIETIGAFALVLESEDDSESEATLSMQESKDASESGAMLSMPESNRAGEARARRTERLLFSVLKGSGFVHLNGGLGD